MLPTQLMTFNTPSGAGALDVAFFIREMIESYPKMQPQLLEQLRDSFAQLQARITIVVTTLTGRCKG